MWEIDITMDSIGAYLEQLRLLKAQPEIDNVKIDNIMWKILGLAIKLDDKYEEFYRGELGKLESMETITIRDELLKRERILELSRARETVLERLFDQNVPEEKELYNLFDDIRKGQGYETAFLESDVKLVNDQLKLVEENKRKEQLLKEEYENNLIQINEIENSMMSFEEFNARLNEEYARFIEINEIDKIDVTSASVTKLMALERQSIVAENLKLLETAQNIDVKQFKYLGDRYENDRIVIEEANELLFMADLANKMREKVNSYEELQRKVEQIGEIVTQRENEFTSRYPNITYPNDFSYRTIFFMNDIKMVNKQFNAKFDIEKLRNRNKEIENELENLYDNVKGRRELDDIINNRVPLNNEEIKLNNNVPLNNDEIELDNIINNQVPLNNEEIEFEDPIMESVEPSTLENNEESILDGEILEVEKTEKAKFNLLAKVRQIKDKLLMLAQKAAPFILSGAILLAPFVKTSEESKSNANDTPSIEFEIDEEKITSSKDLLDAIENLEQQNYIQSIGDKVSVENGTKYYRDAVSAQFDNNSYETGRNGLRPENYNINRIAIMEKDMLGKPTGKILAVNSTPGVSAEELAASLGLEKGQYEVMIHIGSGDENGNYIEAPVNAPSSDDLCWMRADSLGVKLVTPASEILNNSGKGISR